MYAIIEVGAKQYTVKKGDTLEVELQEPQKTEKFALDKVLLVSDGEKTEIGKPYLKDPKVVATILRETKGKKVISYKYRRRKSSHWKKGHRQQLTVLKITDIKI